MKKKIKKVKVVKATKVKTPWVTLPEKSWPAWFSEWLVSHMVMEAYIRTKKMPKQIRLPDPCIKDLPDGSGLLSYEVKY